VTGPVAGAVTGPAATTDVLAHGIGGRQDLPLPLEHALAGAVVALVATFLILSLAWRGSRFRGDEAGRALPGWLAAFLDARSFRWSLRALGLFAAGWIMVAAVFGPQTTADNPAPGALYVLLWVGIPLASLLFGPVWRALNPIRTIHLGLTRLAGRDPAQGLIAYPGQWGYWPGALLLGLFLWLELVPANRATVPVVTLALFGYALITLLGALIFGSRWFERGDPFEVYSSLVARLAPVGRRRDGRLVIRNPFDGLDSIRPRPGLPAVVLILLGGTAYDSFSESVQWLRFVQGSEVPAVVLNTTGLVVIILLVAAAYVVAIRASGRITDGTSRLPALFAHALLPIALGYVVAHYFSLAVVQGQRTVILAADPLGTGNNLLGLTPADVSYALVQPTAMATLQVAAVVVGHVAGAVAAHDRAARLFPPATARWGQLPLLLLMVVYTYLGLTLLFGA
jgi:hypothetical protein